MTTKGATSLLSFRGGLGACPPEKFENLEARKCDLQHSEHQKACCFVAFKNVSAVVIVVEFASLFLLNFLKYHLYFH